MKNKRDFHKRVRVIYRACRKLYGKEKTQDECLKIFKVVFPQINLLKKSDAETASVPQEVRQELYKITSAWQPKRELAKLISDAESWVDLPLEMDKKELIGFYEDITPVAMRIRKLTPVETGRLMGLSDEEIQTMKNAGLSNSALYKCHGNSIVIQVLYHIFRTLFVEKDKDVKQKYVELSLF